MNLNKVKAGDRVESYMRGWGEVVSVSTHHVNVVFNSYTRYYDLSPSSHVYIKESGKTCDEDVRPEIINWEPKEERIYNTNKLFIRDMSTAPKNEHVIILWGTTNNGIQRFNIRVAFQAKNTPSWFYVDDCDYIKEIVNPIGWMPYPKTTNKEETNEFK